MNFSLKAILLISLAICLGLVYWQVGKISNIEEDVMSATLEKIRDEVDGKLDDLETHLEKFFQQSEFAIDRIAATIDEDSPDYSSLIPQMKDALRANRCTAIGAHFADEYDKNILDRYFGQYALKDGMRKLYAPFLTKDKKEVQVFPYDYTSSNGRNNTEWYSEVIGTGSWYGPYFGRANNAFLISYRAPFGWDEERGKNLGNICADYSLEDLRDIVVEMPLLDSGYAAIIDDDGIVLSHPVRDYLSLMIDEVSELGLTNTDIIGMEQDRFYDLQSVSSVKRSGRGKMVYSRRFSSRNWTMLVVLNRDEALEEEAFIMNSDKERMNFQAVTHKMNVHLILMCVLALAVLSGLIFAGKTHCRWYVSSSFSIACLAAIALVCFFYLRSEQTSDSRNINLFGKTDLEAALNSLKREYRSIGAEGNDGSIVKIPTGFFVQSIRFASANDVHVTGYAWQKMPEEWRKDQAVGDMATSRLELVLPEAEDSNIELVYADDRIARWRFQATLRQSFDFQRYPFDDEEIWIRVASPDLANRNAILVPDFESYPNFETNMRNGLERDIFIEGWDILKTYFSLRRSTYSSNFGYKVSERELTGSAHLYFNVSIRRVFAGVFVAYMIPLLVVAFLLFSVLLIVKKEETPNQLLGFNTATVLAYCASLFFVLIVSHMSLRETLQAKGIIYLEYYFFLIYIALAIVAGISIRYSNRRECGWIDQGWMQVLYWPVLSASSLIATAIRFS